MATKQLAPQTPVSANEIDYRDENIQLFRQRDAITAQIRQLESCEELSAAQTKLLNRYRLKLDRVTGQIMELNMPLVTHVASRFTANASEQDAADFHASGVVGLMKAITDFDLSRSRFGSWAYMPILREVLRAVHDADFQTISQSDFENRKAVLVAQEALRLAAEASGIHGYNPTFDEIAAESGVRIRQVRRILEAPKLTSWHSPVGTDQDTELGDLVANMDDSTEDLVLTTMTLTAIEEYGLPVLTAREWFVLARRYGLDGEPPEKLEQIGRALNMSREAIRQSENKAKAKLRHPVVLRRIYRHGRD